MFRVSIIVWVDQPKPIGNFVWSGATWLHIINVLFVILSSVLLDRTREMTDSLTTFFISIPLISSHWIELSHPGK